MTVEAFSDPLEAHIAKGRLEAEGIPTFIADENHIWANWMMSHALGGVKVQVDQSNADAAKHILQQHINGDFEEELNHEFIDIMVKPCPNCGATEYTSSSPLLSKAILVLSLGLIGIIYKLRKANHQCSECEHQWKD